MLVAGISTWLAFRSLSAPALERLKAFWQENKKEILVVEVLFFLAFAGWTLVRAFAPDKILPAGGEKYMEIAFLNGVLNSRQFPPLDPWLSGYAISYYYFGYVMMALLTRITAVAPTVGFDLYDALLFALTATGAYGVVSSMVAAAGGRLRAANLTGLLGALFVTVLGNLEGLLEGLHSSGALPEVFWKWLDIPGLASSVQSGSFYPGDSWWWWRASRVLNDLDLFYQPVPYQPIDEFPFFSFLLGDNHPHKLALPFVLLCAGLALNLLLKKSAGHPAEPCETKQPVGFLQSAWQRRSNVLFYLPYALALGSLGFLNTWDLPIYLALVLLAYAGGKIASGQRPRLPLFWQMVVLGAGLGAGALLLYVFFFLGFASQAGGILPYIFPPTRLVQYLVMFGPFVLILAIFTFLAARQKDAGEALHFPWKDTAFTWVCVAGISFGAYLLALLAGVLTLSASGMQAFPDLEAWSGGLAMSDILIEILTSRLTNPWLFLVVSGIISLAITAFLGNRERVEAEEKHPLSPPTLFALLLAVTGLGLTLTVEFFYLRDLFGMRMNTIFKFYFQGWVLMACASAYAVWWIARRSSKTGRGPFLAGAGIVMAAAMVYPAMAVRSRVESFSHSPILDASASVAGEEYTQHWAAQPDDWKAIQWINANLRPTSGEVPIILEAPGGGYENNGRISAFTGLPALLGWTNHEGQWRGNYTEINRRMPVIQQIYTTPSAEEALDLLHQWNVRYVILGNAERQFIEKTCISAGTSCSPTRALIKFDRFLIPLFTEGSITVYQVPD